MPTDPSQPPTQMDTVIRHIGQLVTMAQNPLPKASGPLNILTDAALTTYNGKITWLGSDAEAANFLSPANSSVYEGLEIIDANAAVITPGLVDSHTHLVFAGDRAEEFHLRRRGISYGELLTQGRGILTTMHATRTASPQKLLELAQTRLDTLRNYGTTTVEVKTGYGLEFVTEELCLHIINELNEHEAAFNLRQRIRLVPTFLGAHSVPPEYRERRSAYVDLVMEQMLPAFANLARFCDVYCEKEAFTVTESRRILKCAQALGYRVKLHADQLCPSGGARLAAELGAVSADHLDYASDADLDALREAGVIATLLPGCSFTLRTPYPSARRLLDRGLTVALATDFNPGTSYSENMQLMLELAMSAMGMTLEEALAAVTINGARALRMQDQIGSIEVGKCCELTLWSIQDYHEIGYHFGVNLVRSLLVL